MPKQRDYNLALASHTRVFLMEGGAGPSHPPVYKALARATSPSVPFGDTTPIRLPDPDKYGAFVNAGKIIGAADLATINLEARMTRELSEYLRVAQAICEFDIQVHYGLCQNPLDFNGGFDKVLALGKARVTTYSTGDQGAFEPGDDAPIVETLAISLEEYYEIGKIAPEELAGTQIVQEVAGLVICDSRQCGECGIPSNGCERLFVVTKSHGGSPGLPAEVIFTEDGGSTWTETNVTTLAATEDPTGVACVGQYLVVISNESLSLHYASILDLLEGTATWTEVTSGFVSTKGPNAIFSLGQSFNWLVGNGGYIYFADNITSAVTVQSSGGATVQNLNAIDGFDNLNLVAAGASNVVLVTDNGGQTWSLVVGPAVGVALNAIAMLNKNTWFVGTANGKLYYTENSGRTWTEKAFPGNGAGQVRDIKFVSSMVGYMAHDTATPMGRILRTIDGGYSWYVLPESTTLSFPANDKIGRIAACSDDINVVYGGGLGDNGTDGFLVKVA